MEMGRPGVTMAAAVAAVGAGDDGESELEVVGRRAGEETTAIVLPAADVGR